MDNNKYSRTGVRLKIERATIYDIFEIANMWQDMNKEIGGESDKEKFLLSLIVNIYREDYVIFVAKKAGMTVGFISNYVKGEIGFCEHIFIKKDFRTLSIDDELIEKSIEKFKLKGVKVIEFITTPRLAKYWERKEFFVKRIIMSREV